MKVITLIIFNIFISQAFAVSVEDCLKDSTSYGSHDSPITPDASCATSLAASSEKISASSNDGSIKVFGQGHMLYVEKYDGALLLSRELLAGDQTKLNNVKSFTINKLKNRLVVVQQGEDGNEVLTYNLEFIGNVAPKTMLNSDIAQYASKAEIVDDANEISITCNSLGKIRFYSDEADSRYKNQQEKFNPVLLRETVIP